MKFRILIVDDHEVVRVGLRRILDPMWEVCGEAANGREAIDKALELKPDLILMDLSMPLMDGMEAIRRIRKLGIPTIIVILSLHDATDQTKQVGADAWLLKDASAEQLNKTMWGLLNPGTVSEARRSPR